uniref:Uncharacterized protein n=1 Tax=Candidatus Methanomethylicus mesodigestus TaxID=1867258 RepID=A0A7C3FBC8_9CREN
MMVMQSLPKAFAIMLLVLASSLPSVAAAQGVDYRRTVHLEAPYQIYEDEIWLESPAESYAVGFSLTSLNEVFQVIAFGPSNETLGREAYWMNTTGIFTVVVNTTGIDHFRLVTTLHYTTTYSTNYTTRVNFFPMLDHNETIETSVILPLGAELLSYNMTGISNSTEGGRTVLSGTLELNANSIKAGGIVYNGSFQLIEIEWLNRTIMPSPSGVSVEETLRVVNVGNTRINYAQFNLPLGYTEISVYDSIGALDFNASNGSLGVNFRTRIFRGEGYVFTIKYSLPPSSVTVVSGRSQITGDLLPSWCKFLVRDVSLQIIMPPGSSDAQMSGGSVRSEGGKLIASASAQALSPYKNQPFALSYVSGAASYSGIFKLAILIAVAIAVVVLYLKFGRRRAKPESPQHPAKPQQPQKKPPAAPPKK